MYTYFYRQKVEYPFKLTSMSPRQGSVMGGIDLRVNGEGLWDDIKVKIGDSPCDIYKTTGSFAKCRTTPTTKTHHIDNQGTHKS